MNHDDHTFPVSVKVSNNISARPTYKLSAIRQNLEMFVEHQTLWLVRSRLRLCYAALSVWSYPVGNWKRRRVSAAEP